MNLSNVKCASSLRYSLEKHGFIFRCYLDITITVFSVELQNERSRVIIYKSIGPSTWCNTNGHILTNFEVFESIADHCKAPPLKS